MPKYSRRDLGLLIPAFAAASTASAQTRTPISEPAPVDNSLETLPSVGTHAHIFNELPETTNGKNRQRRLFAGKTHTGFKLESYESDIAPGEVNHPPHRHLGRVMLVRLDPGDVGFIGSNEIHNARNVDTDRAQYFVLNIGRDDV